MGRLLFVLAMSVSLLVGAVEGDFLLRNYTEVAIATDLEPDDVLALRIIFQEANAIYAEGSKYPIDLIIVGEGNTAIKRMRMEKMLAEYFELPADVHVQVVEGQATKENIFKYDGEEFFTREQLDKVPFPEGAEEGLDELRKWSAAAVKPFVIQLKPAPELLYLEDELASKMTVLFYGSFNIRKTALDPDVLSGPLLKFGSLPTLKSKLDALMKFLSERFQKIAILETFGVVGDQASVCSEFEWTRAVGDTVWASQDPFIQVFRTVSENWNRYIIEKFLEDMRGISLQLEQEKGEFSALFEEMHAEIVQLQAKWDRDQFEQLHAKVEERSSAIADHLNGESKRIWKGFVRKIGLAAKINASAVQFTLADILVAMATIDLEQFFIATPIQPTYDENGFLVPVSDPESNVLYYNRVDRKILGKKLAQLLQ